jgi:hypothetical protein
VRIGVVAVGNPNRAQEDDRGYETEEHKAVAEASDAKGRGGKSVSK